jgi:hypothetical protein
MSFFDRQGIPESVLQIRARIGDNHSSQTHGSDDGNINEDDGNATGIRCDHTKEVPSRSDVDNEELENDISSVRDKDNRHRRVAS